MFCRLKGHKLVEVDDLMSYYHVSTGHHLSVKPEKKGTLTTFKVMPGPKKSLSCAQVNIFSILFCATKPRIATFSLMPDH
jgi:hypothetical protein